MDKFLSSNGIQVCYQDLPAKNEPNNQKPEPYNTILLIAGLGEQLGEWPLGFCELLCNKGFRVIRFDNRDVGRSTKADDNYGLDDMANDAVGILDALDVRAAHIIGMSMGGMIAQLLCANHSNRALSLCSIMSSSGNPNLPVASPEVQANLHKKTEGNIDLFIDNWVAGKLLIDSPTYPAKENELYARAVANCKRSYFPKGYMRHLNAIYSYGSRVKKLQQISCPTLVLHGKNDPLIPYQAGVDTAKHINDAQLKLIEGMGHNLPKPLFDELTSAIIKNIKRSISIA